MSQNQEYFNSPEAIKDANGDTPLISKIKLGTKNFNITSPKDWSENRPAHRAYIYGRTHYEERDVAFSAQQIESEDLRCTHSFENTYLNGSLFTADAWQPEAEWFTVNRCYNVTFKYDQEIESINFEWELTNILPEGEETLNFNFNYLGSTLTLHYDPILNTISLSGETVQSNTGTSISRTNTIILQPLAWENASDDKKDKVQYDITKQLDSKYIAIDNKTIRRNAQGKLQTDELFNDDFTVSRAFGKYPALSSVPAKGKTLKQVIQEAFCENLLPEIVTQPSIEYQVTYNGSTDLVFEYGDTVTLDWKLKFNPGKYSYGTSNQNDSDLYLDKIVTIPMGTSYHLGEIILAENIGQRVPNTGVQELTGTFEVIIPNAKPNDENKPVSLSIGSSRIKAICKEDPEDFAVSSFGTATTSINFSDYAGEANAFTSSAGEISAAYRWYAGYAKEGSEKTFEANTSVDKSIFTYSSLTGLPQTFITNQAKQWFFAVPKVAGITNINLTHQATGAAVNIGGFTKISVTITDAGNKSADYDLFVATNAVADSMTNTYNLTVLYGGTDE
jgi:hypothetical protein